MASREPISSEWRHAVVERHAPALGENAWLRLPEYIDVWPGEDLELLAREFEKDTARFGPRSTLRIRILDF